MFLVAKEKLGLESSGHEAGSADALVPIILQGRILNPYHKVCIRCSKLSLNNTK